MDIIEITVHDLPDDAVVLDVREPDEWAAAHAVNAVHIPLTQLPRRLAEIPDSAGPVAVVCRVGARSARAVAWLGAQGIPAVNVAGGMKAWEAHGKTMVADAGTPVVI